MSDTGFTEEWFGPASQAVLVGLVASVADVDGLLVEVGSWQGRSTCVMANAATPRHVEAVDTWQGSPGEISAVLAADRDVFTEFCGNIARHTRGNVNVHRSDWRAYIEELSDDAPVAMVFIDAEHTYEEVHDTIVAFEPHISPGGVICGDDNHHPPVRAAVLDTLGDVDCDATLWIWRKP
jgi:predicted O-methyltransferase YrrM